MAGKKLFRRKRFAPKDYTVDMLPATRKALFLDVMKLHWRAFLGYGLVFLLFCLPVHLVSLLQTMMVARETAGIPMTPEVQAQVLGIKNTMAFLQIPGIVILFVGLGAFARVIRQYAWGENVFFGRDFSLGFQHNIRQMALLGLLTGVVQALCVFAGSQALAAQSTAARILYLLPVGTALLVGIPVGAYAIVCISIYQNSLGEILRMAFGLTVKTLLPSYPVLLGCLALLAVELIPSFAVSILGKVCYSILAPVLFLIWYLYGLEGIDRYINAHHHPELVGRGLYKETETAAEADEQEDIT